MARKARPGPIIALLVLAGLGVYTYVTEWKGADARHKAEESKDKVFTFGRDTLKAIVLKNPSGTIRLERAGEAWSIAEPPLGTADKEGVESVLTSLEVAKIDRRLGAGGDKKTYGLDPPGASVTIETASGAPQSLGIGDQSPIGGSVYALLPDGKEIAVVSYAAGEAAKKDLLSLRDKTLLAFDPWKVTRLTLERGKETIVLEKPADGWKLLQPLEAPADGPTITDLLTTLERAKATRFVNEKPAEADLKKAGLAAPLARVTILQEGWDAPKTIDIGGEENAARYARCGGKDPILAVGTEIWPKVTTPLASLRRKDLLSVSQYRVASVTAALDGKAALVLTKQKDAGWSAGGLTQGKVKPETMDGLLNALASLKAVAFDDQPAEAVRSALAKSPALDLTLEQEPDADGAAPLRQHLLIGVPGKDSRVRVRDMVWRPMAFAEGTVLTQIRSHIAAIVKEASSPAPAATPAVPPTAATPAAPADAAPPETGATPPATPPEKP